MSLGRDIFPYVNGQAQVWGDPMRIKRRLHACLGGDPGPIVEQINNPNSPTDVWTSATERMLDALRTAFEMVPFDPATGRGATDQQCIAVWTEFCEWEAQKKTRCALSQTSPRSTAPPSSPFLTKSSSACG